MANKFKRKLNIALITVGFQPPFMEATKITILTLAKELKKKGHNPIILSDKRKNLPEKEIIQGINVYRGSSLLHSQHFGQINALKKAEQQEKIQFDIIHNFSSAPLLALRGWRAKKASKNKNIKLIQTIKSRSKLLLGSTKLARFLNLANATTVQTPQLKQELEKHGAKNLHIIHSHVDMQHFKPLPKQELRKKHTRFDFKDGDFVVFYYGPFTKRKGTEYLLKAIPLVWEKNPKIKFLLSCKKQKLTPEYEKIITDLGLPKNPEKFQLLFAPETIPPYLNMADLVVMPYPELIATESNPSCIIESMACKVPIIMSDLPELREFFQNKQGLHQAIYFEPKNPQAIADHILDIAKDKALQKELSEIGYQNAKEYALPCIARAYGKLYLS